MSKKKKSSFTINLEYYLALPLIKIIQILPLKAIHCMAGIIGRVFYLLDSKHRKRTIQHLLHAGIAANRTDARSIARANFVNMAKLGVEIFKLHRIINPENCHEYVKVVGSEAAKKMFFTPGHEKQMIITTAHYGNWEVLSKIFKQIFGRPVTALMRMFDNPQIGACIYEERNSEDSATMISKSGGIRALLKALKKDETVCLLVDQHAGREAGIETQFFGQPARTHSSPALLHLKTGVPILPFVVRRVDNNAHFEIVCKDPICYTATDDKEADMLAITQQITTALEELIRECPDQWMWCHRRWLNINRKGYPQSTNQTIEV